MNQAYIVRVDLGGDELFYVTEMTKAQAEKMRLLIRQSHEKFSVMLAKQTRNYAPYGALMRELQEFVDVRHR